MIKNNDKRCVITDCRLDIKCKKALYDLGFEVILMPPCDDLAVQVASHPDMLMFVCEEEKKIITTRKYYDLAASEFEKISLISGYEIFRSGEKSSPEYPNDVLFNAVRLGKRIICKKSAVSLHINALAGKHRLDMIDTKQGYAKCSCCTVGDSAIITSDRSIAKSASRAGIEVLEVTPGYVFLDGYDCGFIGGASGLYKNTLFFTGNLSLHPDSDRIKVFCSEHGIAAVSLSDSPLYDYGSLIFI